MKCEEFQVLIEEYFDGELASQTAEQVSVHIEHCLSCSREFQQLALESRAYQTYERGIDVSAALWGRVRSNIAEEIPVQYSGGGGRWRESWRFSIGNLLSQRFSVPVAAALVLSAIVGTVFVMKYTQTQQSSNQVALSQETPSNGKQQTEDTKPVDHSEKSGDVQASLNETEKKESSLIRPGTRTLFVAKPVAFKGSPAAGRTPAQLVRDAEKNYLTAIAMLTRDVAQRPSQLDSETRAKLDGALASIDRTISATRKAVQKNPNDPLAVQYMLTAYAKKVDVLKEMTSY